jgi:uncharacterized protein (DUF3084 family)
MIIRNDARRVIGWKLEVRSQMREARDEKREARSERRETRSERREARDEKREARDEKRETRINVFQEQKGCPFITSKVFRKKVSNKTRKRLFVLNSKI